MNASEFPTVKPVEGTLQFQIKDNILRSLIKKPFSPALRMNRARFLPAAIWKWTIQK